MSSEGGAERALLLFLDGVGIGAPDPATNPFFAARLPTLASLLGGGIPSLDDPARRHRWNGRETASSPVDALLGVEGIPQSGTGQATLLTGRNAASIFGRHFGPWVPVRLRPAVENESLLRRAVDAGVSTAFANAYPDSWPGPRGERWLAAPPLAARAAGLLTRHHAHLARGDAVASEIVNNGWRERLGHRELPVVSASDAGRTLGRLAERHRLTFYAHYRTDTVGHDGDLAAGASALERVDSFLSGLLETMPARCLLVICSDHGNLEDATQAGHTTNPSLGVFVGPGAHQAARDVTSLLHVTPLLADRIGL